MNRDKSRFSKYLDPTGGAIDAPRHWASNEVWPTEVLTHLSSVGVESAVLVGSSNFCSIAPLLPDLKEVTFVDQVPGQMELARSKVMVANQAYQTLEDSRAAGHQASSYVSGAYYHYFDFLQPYMGISEIIRLLGGEAMTFDFERDEAHGAQLHYLASLEGLKGTAMLDVDGSLGLREKLLDITKPELAHLVRPDSDNVDKLDWVHVSNVAPVCFPYQVRTLIPTRKHIDEAVLKTAHNVAEFVAGISGVHDETVVTYANTGANYLASMDWYIPTVSIARLGSLAPEQLIVESDILECVRR